jgi:hypothetical protein
MRATGRIVVLALLALVVGAGLALQHQAAIELRDEVALLREQHRTVARLRSERARLDAAQLSPADLAGLRADHAAVARLREEVEALRQRVTEAERAAGP